LDFYAVLRQLRRDGAMVLLSSHALAELEGQVDRVVVMNSGRKVADGAIFELRRHAAIRPRIRFQTDQGIEERACAEEEVAVLLRALPPHAKNIEILRPSLDELYAELQKGILS
jgi:Cu-processing system ATP-binding protein